MKDSIFIKGLPLEAGQVYSFDGSEEWMKNILSELTEDLNEEEKKFGDSDISLELEITRKNRGSLGDYIVLDGEINIHYPTHCVKSFEMMTENQVTPIHAIVLDKNLEKSLELEEETTYFLDEDELDLYFFDRKLEIQPIIHEYVFLNKNPYPKIDSNGEEE